MTIKRYIFTIELSGMGSNADIAWQDALEQFSQDPGPSPRPDRVEDEDGAVIMLSKEN